MNHKRKSIRLQGYDYSTPDAYFVTICTYRRERVFGKIRNGEMQLSSIGEIAERCWKEIPDHFPHIELNEFVVMPNHLHGIIILHDPVGAIHESPLQQTIVERRRMLLPKIVGRYKMLSAKQINLIRRTPGVAVWQRNYYDRIIRNEKEFSIIQDYIIDNPSQWEYDKNNPDVLFCPQPLLPRKRKWLQ